jgi:hypothetical protein
MKNYVIVAIIIILIIVGVVWFKMKSPAPVVPGETTVTTEPAPADATVPAVDASGTPAVQ